MPSRPSAKKRPEPSLSDENRTGLAALAAMAPPPPGSTGAGWTVAQYPAGGGASRLYGRFAICSWGATGLVLLCTEWEVNFDQEFVDGTAHGEYWDYPVPIKMMWTGRAQAYFTTAVPSADSPNGPYLTFLEKNSVLYRAGRVGGDPAQAVFTGWNQAPAPSDFTTPTYPAVARSIFSGSAFVSRASINAPNRGMVTQEIQLRGVGAPAQGILA